MNVALDGNVTDQNGVPMPGALVYVYDAPGALASVYDSMGQLVTNPVTAGEDGYWQAFIATDKTYTLRYYWGGRERRIEANIIAGTPPLSFNLDPNLRADLGTYGQAALSGFIASGTGAVAYSVQDALRVRGVSVKDFDAVGDGTTDDTAAVQAAITAVSAAGGGTVCVPAGIYRLTAAITVPANVSIVGAGSGWVLTTGPAKGTVFRIDHNGDAFKSTFTINGYTAAHIYYRDFSLFCVAPNSSTGAGIRDQAGSYIELRRLFVFGFRYGVVFDWSEQADVIGCVFREQKKHGIWIVNGPDLNGSATATGTNRICVDRCDFNQPVEWGIVDDGGWAHSFRGCDFSGGIGHIRIAGYGGSYHIIGGEFEGSSGPNVVLSNLSYTGRNVSAPQTVLIEGALMAPAAGQPCVSVVSCGALTLIANQLDGTTGPRVGTVNNSSSLSSQGNTILTNGSTGGSTPATFFGTARATRHRSQELILKGTATQDFAALATGAQSAAATVTVTGARVGDLATAKLSTAHVGALLHAEVTADDTVQVFLLNFSGGGVDPASGTLTAIVDAN